MLSTLSSFISRALGHMVAGSKSVFDDEKYRAEFLAELKDHTIELADDIWKDFWESEVDLFCNKRPSAETVPLGLYNGYTVWTFTLGLQSIIEAERLSPRKYADRIASGIETLEERYYNAEYKAYSAWLYAKGDQDVYYDDNAQIAMAFIDAYSLLEDDKYLELARSLCRFLITGWTSGEDKPGGIQWHVGDEPPHTDRCCCSTAIVGGALVKVAKALKSHTKKLRDNLSRSKLQLSDEEKRLDWVALEHGLEDSIEEFEKDITTFLDVAAKCGQWLVDNLLMTEKDQKGDALTNLIADKLTDSKGDWKRDEGTILSYNTGTTLHLLCLLHQESQSQARTSSSIKSHADICHIIAAAAVTPYKAIFNTSAPNPAKRVWSDHPYFTHLLIEGLLTYTATFPNHSMTREIENMILHNVAFVKKHLSSSTNALFYHRNLLLRKISPEKATEWNEIMGVHEEGEVDHTERVYDEPYMEVEERDMARTLLAQAGVARGFALAAERLGRQKVVEQESRNIMGAASLVGGGDW